MPRRAQPDPRELALQWRERYAAGGDLDALGTAIDFGRTAVRETAGSGPAEGSAALELGTALSMLHAATGRLPALDEALRWLQQAVTILAPGHHDAAAAWTNLGGAYLACFLVRERAHDLDNAVIAMRRGVDLSALHEARSAGRHANLAGALRTRYQSRGDLADLDASVAHGSIAARTAGDRYEHRAMVFATYASSLQLRFARRGSDDDLDCGIEAARIALASTTETQVQRVTAEAVLAAMLVTRFEAKGNVDELSEAIALLRQAVGRGSPDAAEYAVLIQDLAYALKRRYERLGMVADLEAAAELALTGARGAHVRMRGECLALRAECLHARSVRRSADDPTAARDDARAAAAAAQDAVAAIGTDGIARAGALITLGNAYVVLHQHSGDSSDHARATAAFQAALAIVGEDHTQTPVCLSSLANRELEPAQGPPTPEQLRRALALLRRAHASAHPSTGIRAQVVAQLIGALHGDPDRAHVEEIVALNRELATAPGTAPMLRVYGAMLTGETLMTARYPARAAAVLATAVRLLPAAAWHGVDRPSQEARLSDVEGLAGEAAAAQLAVGHAGRALEALEQGRSVLWAQKLRRRADDDGLWREHPDIALRLRDIAAALDAVG